MSNKKNFDELQKLAEKVAEIYVDRPEPTPEERVYDAELRQLSSQQQEKQRLLLEAEMALKKDMEEFQNSQKFRGSGYRFLAFLTIFAGFAALFFSVPLPGLPPPIKLVVLGGVLGLGLFSAIRKRR